MIGKCLDDLNKALSKLVEAPLYVDDDILFAAPVPSDVDVRVNEARRFFQNIDGLRVRVLDDSTPFRSDVHYATSEAVIEARENLACIAGPGATDAKKAHIMSGFGELIGWYIDPWYDHWFVMPQHEKLGKIANQLFNVVKQGDT